jgi:DNA polymerase I-like protein with 3'-5' exonuclease and polymerase domains
MAYVGDEQGLLWDEAPRVATRGRRLAFDANAAQLADYTPPAALRPFCGLARIGLDIETCDPLLKTLGSSARRREGRITGVAIAYDDRATYYPTNHTDKSRCIDEASFYDQLREQALAFNGEIVGANLQYDLDWLAARHDVKFPRATLRDVQIAEPLLDENAMTYKLERLAQMHLGEGKLTNVLADHYGADYIEHMTDVDPGYAAMYAETDAALPLRILDKQRVQLAAEDLTGVFEMESALTPLLLRMREVGVRVDVAKAAVAYERCLAVAADVSQKIEDTCGMHVDVWSADSIAAAYDSSGHAYPRTAPSQRHPNGKPSFKRNWLLADRSSLAKLIVQQREFEKTGGTFLKSYILDGHVDGRIHAMFHPLRSDSRGAVSGRFSSSGPNLQNIPARHEELGPLLRSIFIPEEGQQWGCADWSQIEYRFLVHFTSLYRATGTKEALAATEGVDAALAMYRNDRAADFHAIAAQITGVPRKRAKSINFGVVYGMGVYTMADNLGISMDDAKPILAAFHDRFPFLRGMHKTAGDVARERGYIKTFLGRRRRFTAWEINRTLYPSREAAFAARRGNERPQVAGTHKALNALLQGSNADLMKAAMVEMWRRGLFDVLVPHITVHDEFNVSVPDSAAGREAFAETIDIMENVITLQVPVFVSSKLGCNWDDAK